jgi:pimeloyl-ACP methyl ester carboxylesterase
MVCIPRPLAVKLRRLRRIVKYSAVQSDATALRGNGGGFARGGARHPIVDAMTKTLFLPGAGASAAFWRPVAELTQLDAEFLSWPGLGNEPAAPGVDGIDDLVRMVRERMPAPVNLVAQSMGGLVAVKAALAVPDRVKRLVLTATSGGVPVAALGGADWQADYYREYPRAARWIGSVREDLSAALGAIIAPTLLLWGDSDPISPVAVGERLLALLPNARLHVVPGGDHDLARTHARTVAAMIVQHLSGA